jgi:hypothetical protein
MGITSAAQQHRQSTGNHTAQQDAQQRSQVKQDQYTRHLADRPGLHSGNVNRQQAAATVLQFLTFLTSIQNTSSRGVESPFFREGHEDAPPEAGESTANAVGKPATPMMSAIKDVLVKAGDFIEQHDPLKFPGAEAVPANFLSAMADDLLDFAVGGVIPLKPAIQQMDRANVVINSPTNRTASIQTATADLSCLPDATEWTFSGFLRNVGHALEHPITTAAAAGDDIYNLATKGACPPPEELKHLAEITEKLDAVASVIVTFVPGADVIVIAQSIVGPLLTQTADDLEGKPVSLEDRLELALNIGMQGHMSLGQTSDAGFKALKAEAQIGAGVRPKFELPKFHVENGATHIPLQFKGRKIKVPVTQIGEGKYTKTVAHIPQKNGRVRQDEVFFNNVDKEWNLSGGKGKFSRYSPQERKVARKFGIENHFEHHVKTPGIHLYETRNPFQEGHPRIETIQMHGRLVPYRAGAKGGEGTIYNAANPSRTREVVFTEGEWHLKISPRKLGKIKEVRNAHTGKMLDVAVVSKRRGVKIWAQVNRDTGSFYGPKFKLNRQGELEQIGFQGPRIGEPQPKGGNNKGGTGTGVQPQGSLNSLTEIAMPGASFSGKIFQKNIAGSPYVQFFTDVGSQAAGSERLVVSAHGGYTDSDIVGPAVQLSAGTTYKMLTPHDTYLNDPTLGYVVNPPSDFKAYVTLNNVDGKTVVSEVNFNPQDSWPEAELPANYDFGEGINQLGKEGGLQNYRLWQFDEKPEEIGGVLIENRELAKNNKAPLTDVLAVDDTVVDIGNTYSVESTTSLLIKLDENGKLVNAHGERYKEIVFSHCRNHMPTGANIPMYEMRPVSGARPKRDLASEAPSDNILTFHTTRMFRNSVDEPFNVTVTLERFELRPIRLVSKSTAASTSGTV